MKNLDLHLLHLALLALQAAALVFMVFIFTCTMILAHASLRMLRNGVVELRRSIQAIKGEREHGGAVDVVFRVDGAEKPLANPSPQ